MRMETTPVIKARIKNHGRFQSGGVISNETNDGGVTWNLSGYQLGYVPNLIAFDSLTFYAFTGSSGDFIGRTLDGGASWNYPVINTSFYVNDIDFISPAYGFAGSGSGLYLTLDYLIPCC